MDSLLFRRGLHGECTRGIEEKQEMMNAIQPFPYARMLTPSHTLSRHNPSYHMASIMMNTSQSQFVFFHPLCCNTHSRNPTNCVPPQHFSFETPEQVHFRTCRAPPPITSCRLGVQPSWTILLRTAEIPTSAMSSSSVSVLA